MNASWSGPPKQPSAEPVKKYELVLYCAAVLLAAGTKRSLPAHAESGISRTLLLRFSWRDIASSRVAQPPANRRLRQGQKNAAVGKSYFPVLAAIFLTMAITSLRSLSFKLGE